MIQNSTKQAFSKQSQWLAARDLPWNAYSGNTVTRHYGRGAGFSTLVHIILEQQVSLASANAAFQRLQQLGTVTPGAFLNLDDGKLTKHWI
ncbi:MAG: hypothetical protein IPM36_04495 [Lewinellaceae bacterium]|nr:hypothetical protein [Lewinellaceae bacterium]